MEKINTSPAFVIQDIFFEAIQTINIFAKPELKLYIVVKGVFVLFLPEQVAFNYKHIYSLESKLENKISSKLDVDLLEILQLWLKCDDATRTYEIEQTKIKLSNLFSNY